MDEDDDDDVIFNLSSRIFILNIFFSELVNKFTACDFKSMF
jgi:hypothetical protein